MIMNKEIFLEGHFLKKIASEITQSNSLCSQWYFYVNGIQYTNNNLSEYVHTH